MLWSYEKPTEPGKYYVNCGDTVTASSLGVIMLEAIYEDDDSLYDISDCFPVSEYHKSNKFMPFDYDYLNNIGNK